MLYVYINEDSMDRPCFPSFLTKHECYFCLFLQQGNALFKEEKYEEAKEIYAEILRHEKDCSKEGLMKTLNNMTLACRQLVSVFYFASLFFALLVFFFFCFFFSVSRGDWALLSIL